ncbi:putative nucleic acid-binding protein [Aeropyrum pernix]|uniref:Putative nucleic acid-binding protein n=1 Tax=Aeropyrum pernix TaxID=56636 RepID=A0A401H9H9_AERPX|nr:PIN domain-containing protein [Aeropyrum pernix]GBF09067.1 putative nucleic acid-binding protein [Aeropyrum pernix]
MKFVDANMFYYYMFKSTYTEKAATLLKQYHDLATSVGVLDEVIFVIMRRLAEKRLGIRKIARLRSYIKSNGVDFALAELERFIKLVEALDIVILQDYADPRELLEVVGKYNLPPSDAVIALTCKHYGIDTILTFDEDFKRVIWLKIIP